MNSICKDCLHAYCDLYGIRYPCEMCENGSEFTPAVVYTQLAERGNWPRDKYVCLQASQLSRDIIRMSSILSDITGLPILNINSDLVPTLEYIMAKGRKYEHDSE